VFTLSWHYSYALKLAPDPEVLETVRHVSAIAAPCSRLHPEEGTYSRSSSMNADPFIDEPGPYSVIRDAVEIDCRQTGKMTTLTSLLLKDTVDLDSGILQSAEGEFISVFHSPGDFVIRHEASDASKGCSSLEKRDDMQDSANGEDSECSELADLNYWATGSNFSMKLHDNLQSEIPQYCTTQTFGNQGANSSLEADGIEFSIHRCRINIEDGDVDNHHSNGKYYPDFISCPDFLHKFICSSARMRSVDKPSQTNGKYPGRD
jgi:hypothetical protein